MTDPKTGQRLDVSRQEILDVLRPFVLKTYAADDAQWRWMQEDASRRWRKVFIKQKLLRFLTGGTKQVWRVKHDYSQTWASGQYPGSAEVAGSRHVMRWGQEGLETSGWAEKRVHLLLFSKVLRQVRPAGVLEVGSGNGAMLMMLSAIHPAIRFTGIELTEVGVRAAKTMQALPSLPASMVDFLPLPSPEPQAYKKVRFETGNAAALPFEDRSFDLVLTSLALEQMDEIKDRVLREIARVSRRHVLMLEPFPDFNTTSTQRYYTGANNYFSATIESLPAYGLKPVLAFDDFPSKITRGTGLVLAEVAHTERGAGGNAVS